MSITKVAVAVVLFLSLVSLSFAKSDAPDMDIIFVGLGAKNPTFDESAFPHLKFYYTPGLKSKAEVGETGKKVVGLLAAATGGDIQEQMGGEPAFISKWIEEQTLIARGVLFDKSGVCAWEGPLNKKDIYDSEGEGDEENLEDAIKKFATKGKEADFDDEKEFEADDDDALVEMKLPELELTDVSGTVVKTSDIIGKGKAVLMAFFRIPEDVDFKKAEEDISKEKDGGKWWAAVGTSMAGKISIELFKEIEDDVYDYEIED